MPGPKILVIPGSTRIGSHNVKLAALAIKELVLNDVEVIRGNATVACPADLHIDALTSALRHRLHRLGAGLGVANRGADLLRQPAERQLFADRA